MQSKHLNLTYSEPLSHLNRKGTDSPLPAVAAAFIVGLVALAATFPVGPIKAHMPVAEPVAIVASMEAPVAKAPATEPHEGVVDYLAGKYKVAPAAVADIVKAAAEAASRTGVESTLLLALVGIESSYNPFARSSAGALGLTQVMPSAHPEKLAHLSGPETLLTSVKDSLTIGAEILGGYVKKHASVEDALQNYNGALSDKTMKFAKRVLSEKRNIDAALGTAADVLVTRETGRRR